MIKVKEEELEEENSEPTEAEDVQEPEGTVTEQMQKFQEKKAKIEESKKEKPTPKPKAEIDLSKLNAFKTKIVKEFGLIEKIDSHGCFALYYKDFIVLKLLPRKNCWYGVWREVPEEGNKWHAFKIKDQAEENKVSAHIKLFIKTNSGA